ncbi:MAG: hypothetical protein QW057_09510 [Candidatus Bathyarchaeia archaeon]
MENPPRWPRTVHRKATCRLVGRVYALRESGIDSLMAVYHILKMDGLSNPPDRPRRRSYIRGLQPPPFAHLLARHVHREPLDLAIVESYRTGSAPRLRIALGR